MTKFYFVYILTNDRHTVLYIGVTNNLIRRIQEHKSSSNKSSFTHKYNIHKLVYYDVYEDVEAAIAREKQLKAGSRLRKEELITEMNPECNDLYESLL